jgi:hypothetical protein
MNRRTQRTSRSCVQAGVLAGIQIAYHVLPGATLSAQSSDVWQPSIRASDEPGQVPYPPRLGAMQIPLVTTGWLLGAKPFVGVWRG